MNNMSEKIALIIRDVAELPDRNSPEDWPEALIVTDDELEEILSKHLTKSFMTIKKASELIWFDNGMVNQLEPLDEKLELLDKWLIQQPEADLMKIESDLAKLSEEELNSVCCGDETEQENLASKQVNEFLGRIFDEEYAVNKPSQMWSHAYD
ncbi:hypothetical protein ACX1N5_03945 [Acinetobacter sp. ANC 4636]